MMKAIVLKDESGALSYEDVDEPTVGAKDVLIELSTAALNRRDLWITQGKYPGIKFPAILGSDGAGVITGVGDEVDESWIGQGVLINPSLDWGTNPKAQADHFRILGMPDQGTFAERIAVPIENIEPIPGHLEFPEAAALPLAGLTAYRALFSRAKLHRGEKVLITGVGGGVALFGLQFAVAHGCDVYVTSGTGEKLRRAKELGAKGGVLYSDEEWESHLRQMAGGFDLILDSAGGRGFSSLVNLSEPGGRIVFPGATLGNPSGVDMRKIFWKQLSLLGTTMGSAADFSAMIHFVNEHGITPVVEAIFPLEEATNAFEMLDDHSQFGKVVLAMPTEDGVERPRHR